MMLNRGYQIPEIYPDPSGRRSSLFFGELLKELKKGSCVLDLGSGGSTFNYDDFPDIRIYSCDVQFRSLAKRPRNVLHVFGSADKLPFIHNSFDLIIANFVFEHFMRPMDALSECERVMKPNGHFYVAIPNSKGIEDRCYRFWKGRYDHIQGYTFHHFLRMVYCHTSFKLQSFCDYPAGFTWFDCLKKYGVLQKMFSFSIKTLKRLDPDILRTCNFLFSFRKEELRGYHFLTHNCMYCGVATTIPWEEELRSWKCDMCGKSNPSL
jgi:SAM-dependent methyltransferase